MGKMTACFILLVLAGTAGCVGPEVKAKLPLEGKKVSVVPFREQDLYFLESKTGAEIAGLVVQVILREELDTKVIDPREVFDELIRDKNPDSIEWGKVAKKLKVDYIVVGNILTHRARDPVRDVNCFRGLMAIQVTVWGSDNSIALTETVTARYPSGKFSHEVVSVLDTTEEKVLNRLKAKAGVEVARLFFPHSRDGD